MSSTVYVPHGQVVKADDGGGLIGYFVPASVDDLIAMADINAAALVLSLAYHLTQVSDIEAGPAAISVAREAFRAALGGTCVGRKQ